MASPGPPPLVSPSSTASSPDTSKDASLPLPVSNAATSTTSLAPPKSRQIQLINSSKEFNQSLQKYMQETGLADVGFEYHVVAVFGSQSSGKSTLLNSLFNTDFPTMSTQSRQQTTKGIWLSTAPGSNLLVMDVEGTDGRERGDDQDFERKSALFSLATSEVLIVNMWETMIGLYAGANLGLLKTVFEVNVGLFQRRGAPKTLLYFVIRDFTSQTPLTSLSDTLTSDLQKIWESISKPAELKDTKLEEFFDLKFSGVPHRIYDKTGFEKSVDGMKDGFLDSKHSDYIFKPSYKKQIPADGFPHFANSIWEKIVDNKDLDLPTQQQLLAQYRCDEIMRVCLEVFEKDVSKFRAPLEGGKVVDNLGKEAEKYRNHALQNFDKDAKRYHAEVYNVKRQEFINRCNTLLHIFYVQQCRNLYRRALDQFKKSSESCTDVQNFMKTLRGVENSAREFFVHGAQNSIVSDSNWTYNDLLSQLNDEIDTLSSKRREEELKRVLESNSKRIANGLDEPIALSFKDAKNDLWSKVFQILRNVVGEAVNTVSIAAKGFECSAPETEKLIKDTKIQCWNSLRTKIQDECSESLLLGRLRTKFEQEFRYDSRGVPRVWTPMDDIDAYYTKARDEAEKLLTLFSKMDFGITELGEVIPSEIVTSDELTVVPASKVADLQDRLKKESSILFYEAKRSLVATTARIPTWLIILLVILGWNEFMAVLSSPFYFLTLAMLLGTAYIVYSLGLTGPMLRVAMAGTKEVGRQVTDKLESNGVDVTRIMESVGGVVNNVTEALGIGESNLSFPEEETSRKETVKRIDTSSNGKGSASNDHGYGHRHGHKHHSPKVTSPKEKAQ